MPEAQPETGQAGLPVLSAYRLQLQPGVFTFADAIGIVEYLHRLGVSHLYLSPVLTATDGSTHGYDVTNPGEVSAALGGDEGLAALAAEVRGRGMGLIADIVPNHMGVADPAQNPWWWDVLKHGKQSRYAKYFDIDWSPDNGAGGRIALAVLRDENDPASLTIEYDGREPVLALRNMHFPISPNSLDGGNPLRIHDRQAYRLVSVNSELCSYRRFLGIRELAAVRQEDPDVFAATHQLLAEWCDRELIDGVRVDHPDGLADPRAYLIRLRSLIGPTRRLWAERILTDGEEPERLLPIDGTTGYDALAGYGGVFVDPAGEEALSALSQSLSGNKGDDSWLPEALRTAKMTVAQTILASDVGRLVRAVIHDAAVSEPDLPGLSAATAAVLTGISVSRTDYGGLSGELAAAVSAAAQRNPGLQQHISLLVRALLAGGEASTRFQQVAAAISAKAREDRLYYRTARLVSLQEMGCDPARFGYSLDEFHLANAEKVRFWPTTMTTLSTHDTKRGEDVRARISVLSQIPGRWAGAVGHWRSLVSTPDPATCLFLLQNMFGVWPADGRPAAKVHKLRERLHAFAEKASREAGTRTSWERPDPVFEAALHGWIDSVIDGDIGTALGELVQEMAPHFWSDALAQKLLQLCGPGIPDVYQGTELWEDSLADPDNRRPVDFTTRAGTIQSLTTAPPLDGTGTAKMWVTAHALWVRRERPDTFVGGAYLPVYATGIHAGRVIAFGRGIPGHLPGVLAVAARHTAGMAGTGWGDTQLELPPGDWTDRLTGTPFQSTVAVGDLFARLPAALLVRTQN